MVVKIKCDCGKVTKGNVTNIKRAKAVKRYYKENEYICIGCINKLFKQNYYDGRWV